MKFEVTGHSKYHIHVALKFNLWELLWRGNRPESLDVYVRGLPLEISYVAGRTLTEKQDAELRSVVYDYLRGQSATTLEFIAGMEKKKYPNIVAPRPQPNVADIGAGVRTARVVQHSEILGHNSNPVVRTRPRVVDEDAPQVFGLTSMHLAAVQPTEAPTPAPTAAPHPETARNCATDSYQRPSQHGNGGTDSYSNASRHHGGSSSDHRHGHADGHSTPVHHHGDNNSNHGCSGSTDFSSPSPGPSSFD